MGSWGRAAAIGLVVTSAPLAQLGPSREWQGPAERLTTDTPEFCHHLLKRLEQAEQAHPPSPVVLALSGEGRMMCDHGEVRRGVHRLRRAMRMVMEAQGKE